MGFKSDLLCGDFTEKQEISSILRANEKTSQYGLVLTKEQTAALAQTRVNSLKNSGRIEFKGGTVDKIILAFCDSPYISPQNYEETLHGLIGLFYDFKNDTWDAVTDNELIGFMKDAFNGNCKGSLELLSDLALSQLSRHIHCGRSFESFVMEEQKPNITAKQYNSPKGGASDSVFR